MASRHSSHAPHRHLSPQKAKQMLHDNSAHGHPLTPKQKHLMGMIASGKKPKKY